MPSPWERERERKRKIESLLKRKILTDDRKLEFSLALGAPIDDLPATVEALVNAIQPLLMEQTSGPPEALLALATAYLYFTIRWSKRDDGDVIDRAKDLIDAGGLLMTILLKEQGEHDD